MRHPHERVGACGRGRRRAALGGVLLVLAATVLVGPGATPATAHDVLLASEPADGEVLAEAPTSIVLRFSAEQIDVGTAVEVHAAGGTRWDRGPAEVDGAVVTQALETGMHPGAYEVRWRSVSSDGHPLSDTFTFEVAPPGTDEAPEPGTGESGGELRSEAEPAAVAPTEPAPSPSPVAPLVPTPDGASPVVLVAVVLGILGAAAAVLVRLRRRSS